MPEPTPKPKGSRPRSVRERASLKNYAFTPTQVREVMAENARRHGEAKARHVEAMRKLKNDA